MNTNEARRTLRAVTKQLAAAQRLEEALAFQEQNEGRAEELRKTIKEREITVSALEHRIATLGKNKDEAERNLQERKGQIEAKVRQAQLKAEERVKEAQSKADRAVIECEEQLSAKREDIDRRIAVLEAAERDAQERCDAARAKLEELRREVGNHG